MKALALVVALAQGCATFACSCSKSFSDAPACELVGGAGTVFLGTVIGDEQDPLLPSIPNARQYRVRVDRAYEGLSPEATEVAVNPTNLACGTSFEIGKQYIIFATRFPELSLKTDALFTGMCSGNRLASKFPGDVAALEEYARGTSRTVIFGKTLQFADRFGPARESQQTPAPGALVILHSGGRRREQRSAPDGSYCFEVEPGLHSIEAIHEGFHASAKLVSATVAPGGCAGRMLALPSRTEISGTLLDHEGNGVAKTRVRLLRKDTAGEWYTGYELSATTDVEGGFRFQKIPTGEYLLGYDISPRESPDTTLIPQTYYPGVGKMSQATPIRLTANQTITGLELQLPLPRPPRKVEIKVTWKDGSAPGPYVLEILANDRIVMAAENRSGMIFEALPSLKYELRAIYWLDKEDPSDRDKERRIVRSKPVEVPSGAGPVSVHLILDPSLPPEQP